MSLKNKIVRTAVTGLLSLSMLMTMGLGTVFADDADLTSDQETGLASEQQVEEQTEQYAPLSISEASVEGVNARYAYTGKGITPVPVVTITADDETEVLLSESQEAAGEEAAAEVNEDAAEEEIVLVEGVDYTIRYMDSEGNEIDAPLYPGEYQVVIEGISPNFTGTMTIPYEIFMAMGWRLVDGSWYYYSGENVMLKSGWARDSKGVCWLDSNGEVLKNTWLKNLGQWYYLKSNGYMAEQEWVKSDGYWYYMKKGGAMAHGMWIQDGSNWYYMNAGGTMATNKWVKSGGEWYYMKSNGKMAAGEWVKSGGKWYYMTAGGAMASSEWIKSGGKWYYLTASGAMATNQFVKDGSTWYWMNSSGKMTPSKMGCPYVWGAAGPYAFDCSGFTMYMMAQRGIYLPHNAAGQYYALSSKNIGTDWHNAQPGDLVFYSYGGPGSSHHVGIYVGNGQVMHASSSHGRVVVTNIGYSNGHVAAICRP